MSRPGSGRGVSAPGLEGAGEGEGAGWPVRVPAPPDPQPITRAAPSAPQRRRTLLEQRGATLDRHGDGQRLRSRCDRDLERLGAVVGAAQAGAVRTDHPGTGAGAGALDLYRALRTLLTPRDRAGRCAGELGHLLATGVVGRGLEIGDRADGDTVAAMGLRGVGPGLTRRGALLERGKDLGQRPFHRAG